MSTPAVLTLVVDHPSAIPIATDATVTAAFEQYHGELFSFLVRSTRDESAAEDLLQEAFLRLTAECRAGRVPDNVRAWMYRVCSNLATDRGRRTSLATRWLIRHGRDEATTRTIDSPESGMLRRERWQNVDTILASFPAETRTALLLSSQGFSGLEIAEAIGRSHTATRTLLVRARTRMRAALEQREGSL
jgi:RNA polymerase sigma factor (sigma-70 family)